MEYEQKRLRDLGVNYEVDACTTSYKGKPLQYGAGGWAGQIFAAHKSKDMWLVDPWKKRHWPDTATQRGSSNKGKPGPKASAEQYRQGIHERLLYKSGTVAD